MVIKRYQARRYRAHVPQSLSEPQYEELSVGAGMISSESRMLENCMSGSMRGDWKRSHDEE